MSRPFRTSGAPERVLWPDEAEFVVLWLDVGFPLRQVAAAMGMTLKHAYHFQSGRTRKPAARKRLEQRVSFQRTT